MYILISEKGDVLYPNFNSASEAYSDCVMLGIKSSICDIKGNILLPNN